MDLYNLIISAKLSKGEGGDVSVDPLSVTENGTYTASSGHAYSPVTVNVPNTYAAGDEGKVVSNGALVGQTSVTKTANGTYDTTLNDEIVVNVPSVTPTGNINITSTAQTDVSAYATAQVVDADLVAGNIKKDVDILGVTGTYEGGGGGGSSYTLLHEEDITYSTTNTTEFKVKDITIPGIYQMEAVLVTVRDTAGVRNGYYYGGENFFAQPPNRTINPVPMSYCRSFKSNAWAQSAARFGLYAGEIHADDTITLYGRYNSSSIGTVNSTYHVSVYKVEMPDSPFGTT